MKKRLFLLFSVLMALSMLASACTKPTAEPTTEPQAPAATAVPETKEPEPMTSQYKQAPMLDSMDLPPVEERLPLDVMVVQVVDSIGKYGGTWNDVTWWDGAGNIKMKLYDPPVRWKADLTGYEPGLLIEMPTWTTAARPLPSSSAGASSGPTARPSPPPT
jgi:peptide/nickel transport system substrate-binding protein